MIFYSFYDMITPIRQRSPLISAGLIYLNITGHPLPTEHLLYFRKEILPMQINSYSEITPEILDLSRLSEKTSQINTELYKKTM